MVGAVFSLFNGVFPDSADRAISMKVKALEVDLFALSVQTTR